MNWYNFKNNPSLKTIHPNYPGNKYKDGTYYNDEPRHQPEFKEIFQWQFGKKPQRKEKRQDDFQLKCIADDTFLTEQKDGIVWLGHAAFLMRLNGLLILTDPALGNLPFIKRHVKLPFKADKIQNLDYLLLSHGHRDHCDIPSIKKMLKHNTNPSFLIPLDLSKLLKRFKDVSYQEAGWYQEYNIKDDLSVTFLPAIHWNRRGLNDFNEMLWGSFWIRWKRDGKEYKIFFAGDTAYGPHFKEIRSILGEPDIVIMPIGAYKPRTIMKSSHVNPEEAVQGFNELGGRFFIPMHYGTYDLSDEPFGEPIRLVKESADNGTLEGSLKALDVGEAFYFKYPGKELKEIGFQ